jgi:hypothetical protein
MLLPPKVCQLTSYLQLRVLESSSDYSAFAAALRDIDKRDDVLVTVWQGIYFFVEYEQIADLSYSDWKVVLRVSCC